MTSPTAPAAAIALPTGYRLGEYLIEAVLGRGGFGITYRARDTKLGAQVAIKEYFPQLYAARTQAHTILPRAGNDLENYRWGLTEFLKEAQALAKFKHPHIVRVLRFLETNGTAYTVMEYEEGETLSSHLRKHGGLLDEPNLLRIFFPILDGLQAVHEAGLLHLDIKPDNIYLRGNGRPMLIDFGSSRQMRLQADTPQKVMLTQGYCALEQYPGHGDIGAWSDIYGIGASLYRCITGKQPIDALERHQTFERSRIDPLRPASSIERPLYSAHIRKCVDLALRMAPAERPNSAFALQQGLLGKDMARIEKRGPDVVFRPGSGFIGVIPAAQQQEQKRRRNSTAEWIIAVVVLAATATIVVPKLMLDTGHLTETDLYGWVEETTTTIVANARELGAEINARVFGKRAEPTAPPPPRRRLAAASNTPLPEPEQPVPYGSGMQQLAEITMPDEPLRAFGFLKHGAVLATAATDGRVRLWDMQSGTPKITVPVRVRTPAALGIFPSSRWFAANDQEDAIVVIDPLGNREYVLRADPPHAVVAIAISSNGRLLAEATEGGAITIWELVQARVLRALPASGRRAEVLAFSPDERLLAVGDDAGALSLWDTESGREIAHRAIHDRAVQAVAFSPDGKWIGSNGGDLRVSPVALEAGTTRTLAALSSAAHGVVFSNDSQWLLAATAGKVLVWRVETGEQVLTLPAEGRALRSLAISHDGKLLAAADDRTIRIWK